MIFASASIVFPLFCFALDPFIERCPYNLGFTPSLLLSFSPASATNSTACTENQNSGMNSQAGPWAKSGLGKFCNGTLLSCPCMLSMLLRIVQELSYLILAVQWRKYNSNQRKVQQPDKIMQSIVLTRVRFKSRLADPKVLSLRAKCTFGISMAW